VSTEPVSAAPGTLGGLLERRRRRLEARSRLVRAPELGELGPLLGSIEPRLWTPPLRELTPDTSIGFDQIAFAREVLRRPADPWQEWAFIHAGELLPDGRPRFRIVIVLVARQNGKTECPVILAPYWMLVDQVDLILGTSTKLDYARETWEKTIKRLRRAPGRDVQDRLERKANGKPAWIRKTNGEQECWTRSLEPDGTLSPEEVSRYKIGTANDDGGRSLTIDKLILDEIRQHHSYSAWNASEPTTNAVDDAQIWCLSNAGDDRSVVLNDLRESAITYITTGAGDPRIGLFEWSAPDDCDLMTDDGIRAAIRQANPNLGRRLDADTLVGKARRAVAAGGAQLAGFKTENLCIRVRLLDPAIDPAGWRDGVIPGNLAMLRASIALCLDIAPDLRHATLVAGAPMPDRRVRLEVASAWDGPDAVKLLRLELPALIRKIKPRVFGWFPGGPAAAVTAELRRDPAVPARRGQLLLPANVKSREITAELTAVCMGMAEQVAARDVVHSGEALLDAHVLGAGKAERGNGTWVLARPGDQHCDAAYAAAGALHLARTLPAPAGRPRVVVARER
jgi:hypothetical protein